MTEPTHLVLVSEQNQERTYGVFLLNYRDAFRMTMYREEFDSRETAEIWAEKMHPGVQFEPVRYRLDAENLGDIACDNGWEAVLVECHQTGRIVSLAHLV